MKDLKNNALQSRSLNSFHKARGSLKAKGHMGINKEKENVKIQTNHHLNLKSDNKLNNFSEMIPKLLDQIKTKNASRRNLYIDNLNNSFAHDSNSSELNDDKDSENDSNNIKIINNKSSPKKITLPNIGKLPIEKNDDNEYKNLEIIPNSFRQKRKIENSPTLNYRKYSKENKDSLILKLHKYFFQDGELENIDTLIKYNLNKIKMEDNKQNKMENNSDVDISNDFDYFNIKQKVINLMDKFAEAFDKENKNQLISAIKDLSDFSNKYKFNYVTQLTLDWLEKLKDKKYDNCELKYIGYYNQIRDIMDKMLKELKKKADLILISQEKKNKENKKENENENNNGQPVNKNFEKTNSINKEDLLRTKEIVPIKIDIEVQNTLNINEVEEILKNLDEGDLGNLGSKGTLTNTKKMFNKHISNRNDNELEAFSYPFKEDRLCHIF